MLRRNYIRRYFKNAVRKMGKHNENQMKIKHRGCKIKLKRDLILKGKKIICIKTEENVLYLEAV